MDIETEQPQNEEYNSPASKQDSETAEKKSTSAKKCNRKGKTKIPKQALLVLKNWLTQNFSDPYPSFQEKVRLSKEASITLKQVMQQYSNSLREAFC